MPPWGERIGVRSRCPSRQWAEALCLRILFRSIAITRRLCVCGGRQMRLTGLLFTVLFSQCTVWGKIRPLGLTFHWESLLFSCGFACGSNMSALGHWLPQRGLCTILHSLGSQSAGEVWCDVGCPPRARNETHCWWRSSAAFLRLPCCLLRWRSRSFSIICLLRFLWNRRLLRGCRSRFRGAGFLH